MNKKPKASVHCWLEVTHPKAESYYRTCTENGVKNPVPYPPLRLDFTMNSLPLPGDILRVAHGDREVSGRVRNRIFLAQSGDLSGESDTTVKFECDPV